MVAERTLSPSNLPLQLTSFIGREREIAEVKRLLTRTRLLTLTGAGGCGKTRLALHVAAGLVAAYPDGVWLVELAAVADPAVVPAVVASALGVREAPGGGVVESLADFLRAKSLLIVLDNCEHLVAATAHLAEALLRSCPYVRILATSREALDCAGEITWRVPSLAVPPDSGAGDDTSLDRVTQYEAVRLFLDRALATRPGLILTDQQAPALAEICRRLDGIPLAIELAAARVSVFSVEQIAARLDDRFRLLTAGQRTAMPRQQTLRATVDWSYSLLSEPERTLLRRLSVFAGGWTFEAAEAVTAGDGIQAYAVLDLLAQLVDRSLVIAEERRGAVRYRLLETIRQYAQDKLLDAGEAERTRDRHVAFYLRLAEEAEPKLRGPEERMALDRLEEEHDNLRAALEWCLTRNGAAALRLSGALAWFWWMRGHHDEGCRWLMRALAASPHRSAARMKALHGAGWLAHHQRDAATARALLGESLAIARELDDQWTVAWVLHVLGRVAYFDDDPATACALGKESLAVAEALGDGWLIAYALHLLGIAAYITADYPTARAYYTRSLAIRRELGYHEGIGIVQFLIGLVAVHEGDLVQACALFREALTIMWRLLGPWNQSMPLAALSYVAATQGQAVRTARLAGAVAALGEAHHTPLIPLSEELFHKGLAMARRALGETAYAAAWAEGRAMSLEQAVAEALAVEVTPLATPRPRALGAEGERVVAGLTATEAQVLRLLAGGRTTKEIAAELVVAVSTVDRHITHIYQKLGVRNRAEATAVALKHGLA